MRITRGSGTGCVMARRFSSRSGSPGGRTALGGKGTAPISRHNAITTGTAWRVVMRWPSYARLMLVLCDWSAEKLKKLVSRFRPVLIKK